MLASGERFQLITSFNEWGEGTAIESAPEWASASGYGAYLDALHAAGPGRPRPIRTWVTHGHDPKGPLACASDLNTVGREMRLIRSLPASLLVVLFVGVPQATATNYSGPLQRDFVARRWCD
jgi:hypothetical protein